MNEHIQFWFVSLYNLIIAWSINHAKKHYTAVISPSALKIQFIANSLA